MSLPKSVGRRIRDLRKTKGWTQEELAERASLHYSYIGGVERGDRNISLTTLERIASALEVAPLELFRFDAEDADDKKSAIDAYVSHVADRTVEEIKLIYKINQDILKAMDERKK